MFAFSEEDFGLEEEDAVGAAAAAVTGLRVRNIIQAERNVYSTHRTTLLETVRKMKRRGEDHAADKTTTLSETVIGVR